MKKKAFTLVELIVVITVLAILGTISFISLQGYTREARDSKRLSDVNNIFKKISLERTKGVYPSNFMLNGVDTSTGLTLGGITPTESKQGTVNFLTIKEEGTNFRDPKGFEYVMSYAVGGNGTGAYKFIQLATINEEKNQAVLVGDYYKILPIDSPSIVYTDPTNLTSALVEDKKSILPYSVSGIPTITCGNGYHEEVGICISNTNTNQLCSSLPINALYYNESTNYSINQTWSGSWEPSIDALIAGYNTNPLINSCEWKCNTGYHEEVGVCVSNTNTNQTCTNLPVNALYFNGSANYSINQTWGGSWGPSVDALVAGYSATPINNTCQWKCNTGYHEEVGVCVSNTNTNQTCTNLPVNALYFNGSANYSINQTWGGSWLPSVDALVAGYSATPINNTCQWKCNAGYTQDGNTCFLTPVCNSGEVVINGVCSDPNFNNVIYLLHGETLNDSSSYSTPTNIPGGAVSITNTKKVFGNNSILFDTAGYLSGALQNIGTGDFTIEYWINITGGAGGVGARNYHISGSNWGTAHVNPGYWTGRSICHADVGGCGGYNRTGITGTVVTNVWKYIVVQRRSGTLTGYIDGTRGLNTTSYLNLNINTAPAYIMKNTSGYIDELRITKGLARYTDIGGTIPVQVAEFAH